MTGAEPTPGADPSAGPVPPDGSEFGPRSRADRRADRARTTGRVLLVAAAAGAVVLTLLPAPFVIERPGPVFDTLGTSTIDGEEVPLITIEGEPVFPTEGTLDLTTVTVQGSPGRTPNWPELAGAWFDRTRSVQPVERFFPPGADAERQAEVSAAQMTRSQGSAVAASLLRLGYDVGADVTVRETVPDTPADGALLPGDVIERVGGVAIVGGDQLRRTIAEHGTATSLTIDYLRDGVPGSVDVVPVDIDGAIVVGVSVETVYDLPFEVDIALDDVGGPSAGLMFALGITDLLTEGPLTGGARVAGTGTIDETGVVGEIGGIRQKMYGARAAGATVFLAPVGDCDEVVGHEPSGLRVIAVTALDDAVAAVEALATDPEAPGLPACTAG